MSGEEAGLEAVGEDPLIGTLAAERYRILRKLGEGGMGRVYEAEHVVIRKRVAVKCLHAQYVTDAQVVARFLREARAATAIGNEHIVDVTDMGRFADGSVFMVLEYLQGRDLLTAVERGETGDLARSLRIISQVCEALTAAHEKGIIHRDLKPANVFLIERGGDRDFVKVLDFGISKFKDGGPGATTSTGAMLGTPGYMAPEQILGSKDIDHRADLYALGVMLFHMLTGRLPFEAPSLPKLFMDVCQAKAPGVRELRADLPAGIEAVIARLLEKDPALRFGDAESLRQALSLEGDTMVDAPRAAARREAERQALAMGATAVDSRRQTPDAVIEKPVRASRVIEPPPVVARTPTPVPRSLAPEPPSRSLPPDPPDEARARSLQPEPSRAPRVEVLMGLTAFLVLLSIGVGVAINSVRRSPAETPPSAPPTSGNPPVAAPDDARPPTPLAPVAERREVRLALRVRPDDADLFIDGARVLNPYDGNLDVGTHDIEVRRSGYRDLVLRGVTIRHAQNVELRLQRGRHEGPVYGRLTLDDAGVARVQEIDEPPAMAAARPPEVAARRPATTPETPPAAALPAAPRTSTQTSIGEQF